MKNAGDRVCIESSWDGAGLPRQGVGDMHAAVN